jgi:predicted esterase
VLTSASKLVVLGFSRGAHFAILAATRAARLFSRIVLCGGYPDPSATPDGHREQASALGGILVHIIHAQDDVWCPRASYHDWFAWLARAGAKIVWVPTGGHERVARIVSGSTPYDVATPDADAAINEAMWKCLWPGIASV